MIFQTNNHTPPTKMDFFFKSKHPPPSAPNHHQQSPFSFLQQAVSSLQTHFSNFLQHPKAPSFNNNNNPAFARTSSSITNTRKSKPDSNSTSISSKTNNSGKNSLSMSNEAIEERLTGVPVYALSNSAQEFVLVTGESTRKKIGLFCFSEADAQALLQQMQSMDPSMRNGSQIVPVALNKVVQLKLDGVAFRLIPEASQVKHALKEHKKIGITDGSFPGVPVFQSKSLILKSQNRRYCPVFFRKEDLEKSLMRASRQQRRMNPAFREGDIQVSVLEDIIQGMKDDSTSQWDDVVFIPPGFDVSTDPSKA